MLVSNKEYILKWIEKSKNEEDSFDKFVYGFFALNAMYSVYYDTSERTAIKDLFRSAIDNHIEDFRAVLRAPEFEYFCNRPAIKNCKYNPQRDDPRMRDTADDKARLLDRSPRSSNRAMLMILYQMTIKEYVDPFTGSKNKKA